MLNLLQRNLLADLATVVSPSPLLSHLNGSLILNAVPVVVQGMPSHLVQSLL